MYTATVLRRNIEDVCSPISWILAVLCLDLRLNAKELLDPNIGHTVAARRTGQLAGRQTPESES